MPKKLIDILINNEDTYEYESQNSKIKKFCPLGFFSNSEENEDKNTEEIKNERS